MIKISLDLYTPWELDIISEGMGIILAAREAQGVSTTGGVWLNVKDNGVPPVPAVQTTEVKDSGVPPVVDDHTTAGGAFSPAEEAASIATITPGGVTKPEPAPPAKGPSLADVEAAAAAHLKKHGLPATRALVESYGASQIKKVDEAKWLAMLTQLKTEVGE